jgi:hypothetical protein
MKLSGIIVSHIMGFLASKAIAHPLAASQAIPGLIHVTSLPGWPGFKDDGAVLDGTYVITSDGHARAITFLPSQPIHNVTARSIGEKQSLNNVRGCDDISLNQHEYLDSVTHNLEHRCGDGLRNTVFAIQGDMVAFYCEWHRAAQCTSSSAQWAWGYITEYCNTYRSGSVSDGTEGSRTWSYGYTNWRQHDFCNLRF